MNMHQHTHNSTREHKDDAHTCSSLQISKASFHSRCSMTSFTVCMHAHVNKSMHCVTFVLSNMCHRVRHIAFKHDTDQTFTIEYD